MAAAKKLTKKMLERLDRAELRRIAVLGMGMNPRDAYSLDFKGIVSWVHDRSEDFARVDIREIGETEFRDGVAYYVIELQNFLNGGDTPTWPPANVEVPKKRRGPATTVEKESLVSNPSEDNVISIEPTVQKKAKKDVAKKEMKKHVLKKVGLGKSKEPNRSDNVSELEVLERFSEMEISIKSITDSFSVLVETVGKISTGLEETSDRLKDLRKESMDANKLLMNSLLYLINSAIQDVGDEFSTVSDIPDPKEYLN